MNNVFLFLLCVSGLFISKKLPSNTVWELHEGRSEFIDSTISYPIDHKNGIIPFVWQKIAYSVIDSFLEINLQNDTSALKRNPLNPLLLSFHNVTIMYDQQTTAIAGNKQYDIYIFSISIGNTSAESDVYEVYYMKGTGIIGVVNKEQDVPSVGWPKYILKDIQDEKGKSIVDKVMLEKIISQAITY